MLSFLFVLNMTFFDMKRALVSLVKIDTNEL